MIAILLAAAVAVPSLDGTVRSPDGAPIPGAVIVVEQGGRSWSAVTDAAGRFVLANVTLPATLEVHAAEFATARVSVTSSPIMVTLVPSAIRESVIVIASAPADAWRRPLTGTTVLGRDVLDSLPAVTPDEAVRAVAGVSLFRRSSARASNPTTHGVTMRGLSASGASRGLVLLDGVPLNDGFGGWVTWTRVPTFALDRLEIDRGPAGDTFGSDALGGAIELATPAPGPRLTAGATAGSQGIGAVDLAGGHGVSHLSWFGAASWFSTDGVIPVAPESRGAVDQPADAEWVNGFGRMVAAAGPHRLTISAWAARDDRGNGTVLQRNRMTGGTAAVAYDASLAGTTLAARLSISPNEFRQTFSSVSADRSSERLTSTQRVDGTTARLTAEAGRPIPRGFLVGRFSSSRASVDFTDARTTVTSMMHVKDDADAVSLQAGMAPLDRLSLGAGLRYEWRAAPGPNADRDRAGVGHASVAWQAGGHGTLRASVASSHRWPTLNELVRNFQVGSVLTLANAGLLPERARSADLAFAWSESRWHASLAAFWTVVHDTIANVTVSSTPTIVRQRQNAGEAHARGLEFDADARPNDALTLRASALLVDSHFRHSADPALEGRFLPQVPRVSFSGSADLRLPRAMRTSVVWRGLTSQFDDDRNVYELAPASQFDAQLAGRWRRAGWFVVLENAFNARIEVGRSPLVTLAPGRSVRVGVTFSAGF